MIDLTAVKANRKEYRSSTAMLIAANLLPLAGVLFWGWSTFNVVLLYWLENVMIGVINILKMLVCSPDMKQIDLSGPLKKIARNRRNMTTEQRLQLEQAEALIEEHGGDIGALHHGSKLFIIPFFTFHYGIFCLVHGAFVFTLLGGKSQGRGFGGSIPSLDDIPETIGAAITSGALWAILALLCSHLFSFFINFIGKGEYRRITVPQLMAAPYGRIVVLHVAILFGAFVTVLFGSPIFLLVLLIAGKIFLDLGLHVWSHTRLAAKSDAPKEA